MQKIITIHLTNHDYRNNTYTDNGTVEEHLNEYLSNNWTVKNISAFNGAGGGDTTISSGWIVVLLEK